MIKSVENDFPATLAKLICAERYCIPPAQCDHFRVRNMRSFYIAFLEGYSEPNLPSSPLRNVYCRHVVLHSIGIVRHKGPRAHTTNDVWHELGGVTHDMIPTVRCH